MTTQVTQRALIMDLLADFAKQPGCERYDSDSEKVRLMETYLLLRQLTDNLTFERFLEKFTLLADADETNRKLPEDAVKHHCPRAKKQADAAGVPQWSAKEVVDILVLYSDMVREAEAQNVEVPLTLDEFLAADGPAYKRQEIQPPERTVRRRKSATAESTDVAGAALGAATAPRGSRGNVTPEEAKAAEAQTGVISRQELPVAAGQTVIYSPPAWNGRQLKGTVSDIHVNGEHQYVTCRTPDGELYQDVNIRHTTVIQEVLPPAPDNVYERQTIHIPKSQYPMVKQALTMSQPMGNVPLGNEIFAFTATFKCGYEVDIALLNGETGPYVDSQLIDGSTNDVIGQLQPRKNILGDYRLASPAGLLVVSVVTHE